MAPQFFIPSSDRRDLWIAPSYSKGKRRDDGEEESDRYSQGNQQEDRWEMRIWMKRRRRTRPTSPGRGAQQPQQQLASKRRRGEGVLPLRPLSSSLSEQGGEHSLPRSEMSRDVDRDISLAPSFEMKNGEKANSQVDCQEEERRKGKTLSERKDGKDQEEGGEEKEGSERSDREGIEEEEQEKVTNGDEKEKEEKNTGNEGERRREKEENKGEGGQRNQEASALSETRDEEGKETEEKIASHSLSSALTTQVEKDKQEERRDFLSNNPLSQKDESSVNSPPVSSSLEASSLESTENGTQKKEKHFEPTKDITTASLSELVDYLLSSSPSSFSSQLEEKKEEEVKEKEKLCTSLLDSLSQDEEVLERPQEAENCRVSETSVKIAVAEDCLSVSGHVSTSLANSQCDRKISSDIRQLARKRLRGRRNLMEVLFGSTDDSSEEEKEEEEETAVAIEENRERREREEGIAGSSVSSFLISKEDEEESSLHSLAGCSARKLQTSSRKGDSEDEEREKQDSNGLHKALRNSREKKTKKKKNEDLVKVTRRGPERLDRWLRLVAMQDFDENTDEVSYSDIAIPL